MLTNVMKIILIMKKARIHLIVMYVSNVDDNVTVLRTRGGKKLRNQKNFFKRKRVIL